MQMAESLLSIFILAGFGKFGNLNNILGPKPKKFYIPLKPH